MSDLIEMVRDILKETRAIKQLHISNQYEIRSIQRELRKMFILIMFLYIISNTPNQQQEVKEQLLDFG